jgi:HEPN domain-containing protein
MPLPRASEARDFYQSAKQRLADAEFLFSGGRNTGAVYIAGYGIECMLKALILSMLGAKGRAEMLDSFRGSKAHEFEWLKWQYRECKGPLPPAEVEKQFIRVNSWTTALRYKPGAIRSDDARDFLDAAKRIQDWGEGRL